MRVASIGECIVELTEQPSVLRRGFGGDTLNTAVYLARLGADGRLRDGFRRRRLERRDGGGLAARRRRHGARPPLAGAAARFVRHPDRCRRRTAVLLLARQRGRQFLLHHLDVEVIPRFNVVYLSGISLLLFGATSRDVLFGTLSEVKRRGGRVVFDTNFRPRGWPDRGATRLLYDRAFALADVVLASTEDLALLFGSEGEAQVLKQRDGKEIVLKMDKPVSRFVWEGNDVAVTAKPISRIIDTPAAGDSFPAAYLAARLRGEDPLSAAQAGHELAGIVVGYPGAIIPRDATTHLARGARQ